MGELQDKIAIVTGAAGGIGRAIVRAFVREGAIAVLADFNDAAGRDFEKELTAAGHRASFVRTDVASEDDVRALVTHALQRHGRLDVVASNAGSRLQHCPTKDVSLEDWNRQIAVNLTGTFLVIKHCLGPMLEGGGGAIVTTGSIVAHLGDPGWAAYAASKAGIVELTRTVALEHARDGVRVNCVCPGYVDTPMKDSIIQGVATRESFLRLVQPMGRLALPEEVAEAVLFLASGRSSFVTGSVINVDGGLTAR